MDLFTVAPVEPDAPPPGAMRTDPEPEGPHTSERLSPATAVATEVGDYGVGFAEVDAFTGQGLLPGHTAIPSESEFYASEEELMAIPSPEGEELVDIHVLSPGEEQVRGEERGGDGPEEEEESAVGISVRDVEEQYSPHGFMLITSALDPATLAKIRRLLCSRTVSAESANQMFSVTVERDPAGGATKLALTRQGGARSIYPIAVVRPDQYRLHVNLTPAMGWARSLGDETRAEEAHIEIGTHQCFGGDTGIQSNFASPAATGSESDFQGHTGSLPSIVAAENA